MRDFQPVAWEQLPDLGLYMDQVITYLERQMRSLYGENKRSITPAMVNNYVKCGLVDRPSGKKYERTQLAQLLMLCMLKRASSLEDMRRLLAVPEGGSVETLYREFCALERDAVREIAEAFPAAAPLLCAVRAAAYQFLCEQALSAHEG